MTTGINKPARYRGPPFLCGLHRKSSRTLRPIQFSAKVEVLKSLVTCGGSVGSFSMRKIRIDVAALTSQTCPAQRQALLHTFAAGQKDVVWRDETRRPWFGSDS